MPTPLEATCGTTLCLSFSDLSSLVGSIKHLN